MNDLQIKALEIKDSKYRVTDKGITITVYPTGVKTFSYVEIKNGSRKMITVGRYPEVRFSDALKAKEQSLETRKNIRELNKSQSSNFKDVADKWLVMKQSKGLAPGTLNNINKYMNHLSPLFDLALSEIKPQIVLFKLSALNSIIPTYKRVLSQLNEILNYAVNCGLLEYNSCLNLSKTLSGHKTQHIRSIHYSQIAELKPWFDGKHGNLLYALVLTLLRPNEAILLKWDYVDYGKKIITVPAELMKMKREHRVPICSYLESVLKGIEKQNEYIFFGHTDGHLCRKTVNKILLKSPVAPHGFRSMARTYFAEKGIRFEVAESCLAHQEQSAVVRAYSRTDYLEERREVMEQWGKYVTESLMQG